MFTLAKILVPVDFTEGSQQALVFARALADAFGASLHLLHVIGHSVSEPGRLADERAARAQLAALVTDEDRFGRRATVACALGTPALAIVEFATEHHMDLIVMGAHSHGPTFQAVTGSVAESVVRSAHCPVVAVKPDERRSHEFLHAVAGGRTASGAQRVDKARP